MADAGPGPRAQTSTALTPVRDIFHKDPPAAAFLTHLIAHVRALPRRWGVPPADAEDIVQQALLLLVAKWHSIEHPERWVVGTVRNLCRSYRRDRFREHTEAVDPDELELLAGGGRPAQLQLDLRLDLEALCSCLPSRCRQVVHLYYRLGLRFAEVARELGLRAPESARRERDRAFSRMRDRAARGALTAAAEGVLAVGKHCRRRSAEARGARRARAGPGR
jgi:RNA polymerase sigma factor (sigma-70 family)